MASGARPMRKNLSGWVKSEAVRPSSGAPKFRERGVHRLSVRSIRLYENVDVLGRPRLGVKGNGVAANDQILNAPSVEGGQEFFELVEHVAAVPSWRTGQR